MLKIIVLTFILVVTSTAKADEGLLSLEKLARFNVLEHRLELFFKKHQVVRPKFYAELIAASSLPVRKKKIMAAILVPESRGKLVINKSSGATGPWQVMPFWKKHLNINGSLLNPVTNFKAASRVYMIHLMENKNNEHKTLQAYSGGAIGYADKVLRLASSI